MAEIISFPSRENARKEALNKLGIKISKHLVQVFYEKNILDVPVQGLVKEMCNILEKDGFQYEPDVLEIMIETPGALQSITASFVDSLIKSNRLPPGFTLD